MTTRDQQELADARRLQLTIAASFKSFVNVAEKVIGKAVVAPAYKSEFDKAAKHAREIIQVVEDE